MNLIESFYLEIMIDFGQVHSKSESYLKREEKELCWRLSNMSGKNTLSCERF
jgi:hypothetical protein